MILKLLLNNPRMVWMIFIKTLKYTTQIKKCKILIAFDYMITMLSNKTLNPIVTELFIRGWKLNISLAFITQSCCAKNIWLNSTHYFIMKIEKERELCEITYYHSSYINFKDFMNLYKKCTAKPYSFLADAALASDNHSSFRKNLLERI